MASLEKIVRPFQSREFNAGTRVVTSRRRAVAFAELKWGVAGKMPTPQAVGGGFGICNEVENEQLYRFEDVKVEQEGNPNNYVIVRRKTQMTLSKSEQAQVLHSDLTAGIEAAFADFDSDIASSFVPESESSGTSTGNCQMTINLKVDKTNTSPA